MADRGVVLLTGATGFIGTHVARRLLTSGPCEIIALVRADSTTAAARRLARAWWEWPDLVAAIGERVQVIAGDLQEADLGLDHATYADLTQRITHVVHAAADLRLDGPVEAVRRTNVDGTAHMLDLARTAHNHHGLKRFAHISTAYVCGKRRGTIDEGSFSDAFGFSTTYERTKFEGEALVRAAAAELPVSIFRPGMVVGDSQSGAISTFNTLYGPLRLYLMDQLPFVPASPSLRLNIVPVDYVADAVVRLTFEPDATSMTFHLVSPSQDRPTAAELLNAVGDWVRQHLDRNLHRPMVFPLPLPALPNGLAGGGTWRTLSVLHPYLNDWREFRRDNLDRFLGRATPHWRGYLPRLLEYAVAHGFMNRSERTVHEQIVHRLASTQHRVTYHDITPTGTVTRRSAEVRAEMLAAAAALRALGIRAGDRVAIVGTNSSQFLTLDVAIGLVGGVSVPLYYTSPPAEIDALVAASGARALLFGAPRVLERSAELRTEVPLVAFSRGALPDGVPNRALTWEAFLALAERAIDEPAPVALDDLATIRYTSGTTGLPKGVMFHHGNLRWMAETMAALLPWKARTGRVTYLSFLPMNHVVEGILATYSAYYLPAAVDVYFLEDFHQLASALRATPADGLLLGATGVRESMENLAASRLGRWYLRAPTGSLKWVLRWIARRTVLVRAGFDRTVQLMVGSAAVSEGLLQSFRELGIEVHNAYGLTEAPLVTLNRIGCNMLGTVGQPLPETEISIAADGEVLVRGPQVTLGYDELEWIEQPLDAGWLQTGDLGRLTPAGNLVIEGRKKEIIATSYGKKIQPARVEDLLRQIPNVSDALVIGEARPFCAALLWTERGHSALPAINAGVERVNAQLSHAEQLKRWAVLDNDLSIERGDLTPNLKLKRAAVARRFERVIQGLYGEAVAA